MSCAKHFVWMISCYLYKYLEVIATIVPILLKRRLRFRVAKALTLDQPARKWWFIRPQSQNHLNVSAKREALQVPSWVLRRVWWAVHF